MSAHFLYRDFFRFLEALAARPVDPWEAYQTWYVRPNRPVLEAWWEQCMGLPEMVWAERVRALRAEHYGMLYEVTRDADLGRLSEYVMARCESLLPVSPEPEVYYLVGFFSPEAFTFRVEGKWGIGVGLERFSSLRALPILLAHEYAHCYRRSRMPSSTLGERMVDEGFAVEPAVRAFPERTRADHQLMRPGQVSALQEYEDQLWAAVEPYLASEDEDIVGRLLYGRAERGRWPSRAGVYLGWRLASAFLDADPAGFDACAERVLAARPRSGR